LSAHFHLSELAEFLFHFDEAVFYLAVVYVFYGNYPRVISGKSIARTFGWEHSE